MKVEKIILKISITAEDIYKVRETGRYYIKDENSILRIKEVEGKYFIEDYNTNRVELNTLYINGDKVLAKNFQEYCRNML